jgi:hypothetical protein
MSSCIPVLICMSPFPLRNEEGLMLAPFPSWIRILFLIMGDVYHLLEHLLVHGMSPIHDTC